MTLYTNFLIENSILSLLLFDPDFYNILNKFSCNFNRFYAVLNQYRNILNDSGKILPVIAISISMVKEGVETQSAHLQRSALGYHAGRTIQKFLKNVFFQK